MQRQCFERIRPLKKLGQIIHKKKKKQNKTPRLYKMETALETDDVCSSWKLDTKLPYGEVTSLLELLEMTSACPSTKRGPKQMKK
jgi:hypothetical protein